MAQRRHHYESAFEAYLRTRRIPYVAVDEARKALLPQVNAAGSGALKSFDFVLYGQSGNLLAEVKGRRAPAFTGRSRRLEHWVTRDDVESLLEWERLFGAMFEAAFIFIFLHEQQPPDALFEELFTHAGHWYALRVVSVRTYARAMHSRSQRWGTVDIEHAVFEQLSEPFTPSRLDRCGDSPPILLPHQPRGTR